MLRRLLTLIGAVVLSTVAQAGDGLTVGAHLRSWHSQPGYNNDNPGLYVRTAGGWTAGAYCNSLSRSERKPTAPDCRATTYVGRTWSMPLADGVEASLLVGAATGYQRGRITPVLAPSLRIGGDLAARITVIPPPNAKHAGVVHLTAEWRL